MSILFYVYRGIRLRDYDLYNPLVRNIFFCINTGKAIPIERLNDDYCDCEEDGSDEPETNACANGKFYCTYQKRFVYFTLLDSMLCNRIVIHWVVSILINYYLFFKLGIWRVVDEIFQYPVVEWMMAFVIVVMVPTNGSNEMINSSNVKIIAQIRDKSVGNKDIAVLI